ncbi:MAG: hypothetical protein U0103_21660 [Candidatus Obscuribacterales bacterium]
MSGETATKTDNDVKTEVEKEAKDIKGAGSPEAAYQMFRKELDELESKGYTKQQRGQIKEQLKTALGNDVDKVLVGYLKDENAGAKLKDSNGQVTSEKLLRTIAATDEDSSEADRTLPKLLLTNFDRMAQKSKDGDGDMRISSSDITATENGFKDQVAKAEAQKDIKESKCVEALIGQNSDRLFNQLDVANQWTSTPDGLVSKRDLDRFLSENQNPNPSETKSIEALKYIQQHWNDDIGKTLRGNGSSYLSKDSMAAALGYKNAEEYRAGLNDDGSPKQKPSDVQPCDSETTTERPVNYGSYSRTFRVKDGQLVGYTDKSGETTAEYTVDKEGTVTKTSDGAVAGYNAKLSSDGTFTYNKVKNDESSSQKDVPQEAPKNEKETTDKESKDTESKDKESKDKESKDKESKDKESKDKESKDNESKNKVALYENSVQRPTQGYWQVARQMLQNGDNDAPVSAAENTMLMRALQQMHKRDEDKNLRGHHFVENQQDLKELTDEITNYAASKPAYRIAAPQLIQKLNQMATTK